MKNRGSKVFVDFDGTGFGGGAVNKRQQLPTSESRVKSARYVHRNDAEQNVPPTVLSRLAGFRRWMGDTDRNLSRSASSDLKRLARVDEIFLRLIALPPSSI